MVPDDRLSAFFYLLGIPTLSYVLGALLYGEWVRRPVVTKCPFTGELYIPRSKLLITGKYTRRHGPK